MSRPAKNKLLLSAAVILAYLGSSRSGAAELSEASTSCVLRCRQKRLL